MNVIVTGATGMVGEGVLHVCLNHPGIEKILVVGRRSCGVRHSRVKEIVHPDLYDLSSVENQLSGYDACFFCLGISSVGISAEDYYRTTYTLTLHFGEVLSRLNPGMTFCYISGAGTESSEKGRIGWARVKGKTENDLMKLPLRQVFTLRPAFIRPIKGLSKTHSFYKYINWLFPVGRIIYPAGFCTMQELARAMVEASINGYKKWVLEGNDIIELAKKM